MELYFKTAGAEAWTLTDNRIILGCKEIFLVDVKRIQHSPAGFLSNGTITVHDTKSDKGFVVLVYGRKQKEEGMQAAEYIQAFLNDPAKMAEKPKRGFQKCCNICGHIFCYTKEDLAKSNELKIKANYERSMGKVEWWTTSMVTGNQRQQRADDMEARVVDYNKCPKCGSTDIRDATDADIENSKSSNSTVVQQPSAADELKKLKELLDMEVITQEEFDAKKKQLLGL